MAEIRLTAERAKEANDGLWYQPLETAIDNLFVLEVDSHLSITCLRAKGALPYFLERMGLNKKKEIVALVKETFPVLPNLPIQHQDHGPLVEVLGNLFYDKSDCFMHYVQSLIFIAALRKDEGISVIRLLQDPILIKKTA